MIAWANLRACWPSLLAAVLAVATGVALLGAELLVVAATRPAVQPRLAATAALAVPERADDARTRYSDGRIAWSASEADALAARLAAVPGVAAAIPDRAVYAQPWPGGHPAGDPERPAGGHTWSTLALGGYRLTGGVAPSAPGEVAVDRALGVPPGSTLPVALAGGVRVTGVLGGPGGTDGPGDTDGPGVFLSDAEIAALAPGVRAIGVLAPGGVPHGAAAALGPAGTLLSGDARGAVEPPYRAHERFLGDQVLVALGLLTLVTTVVVVSATLALVVAARRRELGLLRTVGATPGQVRRVVLGESVLVGVAGAVLGAPLAVALAVPLHGYLAGLRAADPLAPVPVTPGPLLAAAAVGVVVAVTGALGAARDAARAVPLDAVVDRVAPGATTVARRWAGGGALLLGAGLVAGAAGSDGDGRVGLALGAACALVVAAALLAPAVVGPLAAVATAPVRRGPLGGLVAAELRAAPRRTAAVAAPVIVAVGFATLLSGMVATMAVAYPAEQTARLAGQAALAGDGTPGLTDDAVGAVAVPGARLPLPSTVVLPGPRGSVMLDVVGTADPRLVRRGEVVLSEPVAASLGLTPGDVVPARFADGVTDELRVSRVLPVDPTRGDVAVDRATVRRHDPSALTATAFLPDAGVPAHTPSNTRVLDARSWADEDYAADARITTGLVGLLAVSAGYGALAVVNGVATGARARRAGSAVLAAAGATRSQRVGVAAAEAGVAALLGGGLGLLVPLGPLAATASGLSAATGTAVSPQLDVVTVVGAVGACAAAAVTAAVVVALRAEGGATR